ncbi:hypothetical protein GCM10010464_70320 [Pseudonocardia yunnanensis]
MVHHAAVLITIAGVPAHPLLVHAVVVLIPLAALGAVCLAVRPAWIRPYGLLVAAGALAGAAAATLAKLAGDQLEAAIDVTAEFAPVIAQHGQFGLFTMVAAWPFAVLAIVAAVLSRRPSGSGIRLVGALSAASGLVAIAFTVLAGHSGSAAVWGYVAG